MLLDDIKIHVKIKLALLWTSVMFCYIYADYFGLYVPGSLKDMMAGQMGPLGPTTQGVLLGTSLLLAIPSVMVFLSIAATPIVSRWLNIIFGTAYTVIAVLTSMGAWNFYVFFVAIEVVLQLLIVWYAWSWPRREAAVVVPGH